MNRPAGGVYITSISLGYENNSKRLQLFVEGTISAMGLSLGFMGLAVTIPLEDVTKPRFDRIRLSLDGLILSYENETGLSLSGMFLRTLIQDTEGKDTDRYEYIGQVAITTKMFSITGIGLYRTTWWGSSAFVYASLLYPLGGIPALFIEGLALGMGYNRGIKPPPIEVIHTFPLVTALYEKNKVKLVLLPQMNLSSPTYVKEQFALLSQYLPSVKGQHMMAIGLKVSTYKLVNSIAVLMVGFGERSSWHVVGISYMQLPPNSTGLPYCVI